MCYSAMLESSFARYVRETGAEMDYDQFEEIFGWREAEPLLRITRCVDRWFDSPQSPAGQRIAGYIGRHNARMVTSLEQAVFEQRKRVVDAERKLAVRPTKAAAESARIGGTKLDKALRDLSLYAGTQASPLDARVFSMRYAPIVMNVEGRNVVRLARYHLRRPGDPAGEDRNKPGLYNARRDNLERYWRRQFGATHAIMLMWSFFEWVDRLDGSKVELHFRPQTPQLMHVACIYAEWQGEDGRRMPCFAAITDEPPPEVAAAGHNRCPINLTHDAAQHWLTPQGRSDAELQALLDERQRPYYEHEVLAA
jgi:putative SOS response-associated peptidase YedK